MPSLNSSPDGRVYLLHKTVPCTTEKEITEEQTKERRKNSK
jgi:hypothetical protein